MNKSLSFNLSYIFHRLRLILKINKLHIEEAGVDEDGMAFIKLIDGPFFFGTLSNKKLKKYYNLLNRKNKKKLPFECFLLANDIIIRYLEGGLKLGGPRKELLHEIKPGEYVAEMGSYLGHYTLYLSNKVGSKGKVIAIEPMPDNLKILKKNIKKNNLKNVIIVGKGVWHETGTMVFQRKPDDFQSGSIDLKYSDKNSFTVDVDSLDNIISSINIDHVDVMMIQLNGVEKQALMGLNSYFPKYFAIAARYSKPDENNAVEISNILKARNYKVKIVNRNFVFAIS